jgi:hypothetical protein
VRDELDEMSREGKGIGYDDLMLISQGVLFLNHYLYLAE